MESRLAGIKRRRTGKGEETGMPTGGDRLESKVVVPPAPPPPHHAPTLTPPPVPDVLGPHHARAELAYGTV